MQRRFFALVVTRLALATPLIADAAETPGKEAPGTEPGRVIPGGPLTAPEPPAAPSATPPAAPTTPPAVASVVAPTTPPVAPSAPAVAPTAGLAATNAGHRVDTSTLGQPAPGQRAVDPFVHGYMPDTPASSGWVIGHDPRWSPGGAPDRERRERPEEPKGQEKTFRAGLIVGVGAPSLMSFGLTTKITRYLGLGASFGVIPEMQVPFYGQATLSYQSYSAFARIHPFGGGFFLGSGLGYVTMHGTYQQSVDVAALTGVASLSTQTLKGEGSVRSFVVNPQLGYQAVFASGFLLGFDVGAQIPLAASQVEFTTNVPGVVQTLVPTQYSSEQTKVRDTLQRVGQQILPTVNLQMGWLF